MAENKSSLFECLITLLALCALSSGEGILNHIPCLKTLYLPVPDPEAVKLDHLKKKLATLRKILRDYRFRKHNGSTDQSAHIGLFGEMSAGKSSFMNSLEFAFSGEFEQSQAVGGQDSGGGKTTLRTQLKLTDNISIFDNRGMSDFQKSNLEEITAQLRGERGPHIQPIQPCEQEEIHCGVFVFKIPNSNRDQGMVFIEDFARTLRNYNGYPPMIVITHAASLSEKEIDDIRNDLSIKHDINENVWFFENYTKENRTEDEEKSIKMLEFLQAALEHCKLTIVNVDRRKKVVPVKTKQTKTSVAAKQKKEASPSTSDKAPKEETKSWCVIS